MRPRQSLLKLVSSVALSASVAFAPLSVSPRFDGFHVPAAEAAQQGKKQKLTATQLMIKMEQALVITSQRLKRLPARDRARSAPLVKALVETSRALKAVKKAAAARNRQALAKALPRGSASVARLENAFRLSGIRSPEVAVGVTSLKRLWQDYLKRSPGSKAGASKQAAVANSRRIAAMRRQIAALEAKRSADARARWEMRELQRRLDRAEAANRSLSNQWLATLLLAEALGLYSGYYDYIVIYHPDEVVYYRDSYASFSAEVSYSFVSYTAYYESYSWNDYDRAVYVDDRYDFGMNRREYARFETSYVKTYERYETVTETTIVNRQEIRQLDQETQIVQQRSAAMPSAALVADPQADAVEVVDDNAPPDAFLAPAEPATPEAPPEDTTAVPPAAPEADPAGQQTLPAEAAPATDGAADPAGSGGKTQETPPAADPQADAPAPAEPQAEEPKAEEPPVAEPQAEEPQAVEPPAAEPQAEEPQAEEPQAEEPQAEEPQAEEPQAVEPQAVEPQAEEPQAVEPQAEEPQAEAPQTVEPQAEEPQAEEPQAEEPQAEEPQAEEPQAEEPQAEEPQAEEPQAEEPQAEEPQVEEPAPEPQAEEPQVEEQAAPEPQYEEPAPEPQAEEPQVEEQAAPEPQYEEPAPEPQAEEPQVEEQPEPEPQYEEPAPEPQAEEPQAEEPPAQEEPQPAMCADGSEMGPDGCPE